MRRGEEWRKEAASADDPRGKGESGVTRKRRRTTLRCRLGALFSS